MPNIVNRLFYNYNFYIIFTHIGCFVSWAYNFYQLDHHIKCVKVYRYVIDMISAFNLVSIVFILYLKYFLILVKKTSTEITSPFHL